MNAITRNRPITKTQRSAVEKLANQEYAKIMEEHENKVASQFSLMFSIALMMTLEEYLGYGKKRRNDFKIEMSKRLDEISEFLLGNTYKDQNNHETYDAEYNHSKLEELANRYDLPYDDSMWAISDQTE